MSEFINNNEKRIEELLAFSKGIIEGQDGKMLINKYQETIDSITPHDLVKMESIQLENGISTAAIKKTIGKIINVLFKSLEKYEWKKPEKDTFLYYMIEENLAFESKLDDIRQLVRIHKKNVDELKKNLTDKIPELLEFEDHYGKKENILFPFVEKKYSNHNVLTVMWSIHDDIRKKLKQIINLIQNSQTSLQELHKTLGEYFFLSIGMVQKEKYILFPLVSDMFDKSDWDIMHQQSFDYSFPFIKTPRKPQSTDKKIFPNISSGEELKFKTETGELNFEQITMIFNNIPVDITYVDEKDEVRYFNNSKDRFFPRSPAIIGRKVQNCHPPESVHVIEKIIASFRDGSKNDAKFWIQMKQKFILIQYFAIRNSKNEYRGVLEVSQEISDLKKLEGEKRLLDWE